MQWLRHYTHAVYYKEFTKCIRIYYVRAFIHMCTLGECLHQICVKFSPMYFSYVHYVFWCICITCKKKYRFRIGIIFEYISVRFFCMTKNFEHMCITWSIHLQHNEQQENSWIYFRLVGKCWCFHKCSFFCEWENIRIYFRSF